MIHLKIYNIETLCNYEIINKLFYQKNNFIVYFFDILLLFEMCVTEKTTYM